MDRGIDGEDDAASRHLAYLRNSGWVDDRREGVRIYYSIPDSSDILRTGMIEVLRSHLATLPTAVEDARRLAECLGKSCSRPCG